MKHINLTIWNEFRHEKEMENVKAIYPNGIHAEIKTIFDNCDDVTVTLAALDGEYQGFPEGRLENTDVLIWWGHMSHGEVSDELVEKIRRRVIQGMGLIVLHSGHHSKLFKSIIGDSGNLLWGDCKKEIVWNVNPTHPIAAGLPSHFTLECEEVYAEPFRISPPDEQIFISWFENGYVFRSGNLWRRGTGKVFYFQPGHEVVPSFKNEYVRRIIKNAVYYVAPSEVGYKTLGWGECPYVGGNFVSDGEIEKLKADK